MLRKFKFNFLHFSTFLLDQNKKQLVHELEGIEGEFVFTCLTKKGAFKHIKVHFCFELSASRRKK